MKRNKVKQIFTVLFKDYGLFFYKIRGNNLLHNKQLIFHRNTIMHILIEGSKKKGEG